MPMRTLSRPRDPFPAKTPASRPEFRSALLGFGPLPFAGLLLALACSPADRDVPAPPLLVDTIPGITGSFIVIPDSPSCANCRIELVKVATIGESEPPGALTGQARVFPAADGRYYVLDVVVAPGKLMVFDSAGHYVTAFGRTGQGPGEFRIPSAVISRGPDTIQVADDNLRRLTTFTTPDYRLVRVDDPLPLPVRRYVVLDDGTLVVNGVLRTRERIGYPLHLVGNRPEVLRSFGTHSPSLLPGRSYLNRRFVARAGGDRVWSARRNRFVVELWNAEGEFLGGLVRQPSWFEPWVELLNAVPWARAPQPRLEGIHTDEEGRLWAIAAVADAEWSPSAGPPPVSNMPGEIQYVPQDYHRYFDTVVEVWDPEAARVLARTTSDLRLFPIPAAGLLYSKREDDVGNYFIDVWRLDLVQSN